MNGTEQKAHTKRTDQLAADLETLDSLLHETAKRVHDHGLQLKQHERWPYAVKAVATGLAIHDRAFTAFMQRGFWGRLRWLFTGR